MQNHSHDPQAADQVRMIDEQIRARGIDDPRVLAAMAAVSRDRFVIDRCLSHAFTDQALPIDCGQTISQPYMVACMTACLAVEPHHRVLEIGTGSGYQTAILARLARQVYTVERIEPLLIAARQRLESLGITNIQYRIGDGTLGWLQAGPFDRIMVTAGAPKVPAPLVSQLANHGRLVIPVGGSEEQTLLLIQSIDGRIIETPRLGCRFVKLIGEQGWSQGERDTEDE